MPIVMLKNNELHKLFKEHVAFNGLSSDQEAEKAFTLYLKVEKLQSEQSNLFGMFERLLTNQQLENNEQKQIELEQEIQNQLMKIMRITFPDYVDDFEKIIKAIY